MPRPPLFPPISRRATVIAVALAVSVHVGLLAWASRRTDASAAARPPGLEGVGAQAGAGGLPATKGRNEHDFRVVDWENGAPVPGVRVTDVIGENVVTTDERGNAVVFTRPAARLIMQFEKPGFAMVAREIANTDTAASFTTIRLEHADVPYALIDTIFIQKCNYCHGAVGHVAGVDLTSFNKVAAGVSRHGALVRPHDPDSSRLVRVLSDSVGPDGKGSVHRRQTPRLDDFELATIVEWIREGARYVVRP